MCSVHRRGGGEEGEEEGEHSPGGSLRRRPSVPLLLALPVFGGARRLGGRLPAGGSAEDVGPLGLSLGVGGTEEQSLLGVAESHAVLHF